jgi:ADP-ribose pyrophosphatase
MSVELKETYLHGACVYDGKLLKVFRDVVAVPGGSEEVREVIRHPGAAVIVPELADGRFLLVRQFRYALGIDTMEFPAGKIDPGEDPLNCARRELQEETGYRKGEWEPILKAYPLPGYSDELHWFYHAIKLLPGSSNPDPDEKVVVEKHSPEEIDQMIRGGEITDGKTIIAWLYMAHCS